MSSLSALAGGVAHDLNNALGPLIGRSDLVSGELERLAQRHCFEAGEMCADRSAQADSKPIGGYRQTRWTCVAAR